MYEKQAALLGCPFREFPPMADPSPILAAYQEARRRAGRPAPPHPGILRRLF